MLSVGSLFSGIGGFDLGLERAGGFRTAWFCEQDEFCQRVLAKHWPGVPCYPDVTELRGGDVEPVDVLCGGFPCQDLSYAGAGAGLDGERSGLWSEYARLVGELRPQYVVVENVSALLARGLGRVLGDLAALGYDAEWDCIPASAVGAPHRRDRIWVVAYPAGERHWSQPGGLHGDEGGHRPELGVLPGGGSADVADADEERRDGRAGELGPAGRREPAHCSCAMADADQWRRTRRPEPAGGGAWWAAEPDVGRVAHGVPARMDRLRALGNALVPQIAEWIGRRILESEGELDT